MENRPKISVPLTRLDWLLEALALLSILVLIFLPIYYYDVLPDKIPRHYNLQGQPDAYGGKSNLWVLALVGALLYLLLTVINRFPQAFNYPQNITPENARIQYAKAARLVRWLKVIIGIGFAFMTFRTIQVALRHQQTLGQGFFWIFTGAISLAVIYYLFQALSAKKNP